MELDAWDRPASFPDLEGAALQEAMEELCERRSSLFLATPYLTFASRFIAQDGHAVKVRATMSRTVAQHTLARKDLSLRFNWGLTLYGGPTRILEYVQDDAGKFLRLARPAQFRRLEQRRAFRAEHVGHASGTLGGAEGNPDMMFVRFNLESIATTGLAVFCLDPLPGHVLGPGRRAVLEFTLEQGPEIRAGVQVCHASGQTLGLAFNPPLTGLLLDRLSAWIQPRFEEAQRHWEGRASLRALAERTAAPRAAPSGVLLLTRDPVLAREVTEALAGSQEVRLVPPVLAPFKEALDLRPPFLLALPCSGSLDECHLLRTLLEMAPPHCPVVVLTAGEHREAVRAFAAEVRATLTTDPPRRPAVFFRRLILGLIRKHWSVAV